MKQKSPDPAAEGKEKYTAGASEKDTAIDGLLYDGGHFPFVVQRLHFRYSRKEHGGYGIGDGGGKEDAGQCHACQYTVDGEGIAPYHSVHHQTDRNRDRLHTLQNIKKHPVGSKGAGEEQKLLCVKEEGRHLKFRERRQEGATADTGKTVKGGGNLTSYQSCNSDDDAGTVSLDQRNAVDQINRKNPYRLFQKL